MSAMKGGKTPGKPKRKDGGFPSDFFTALSKGDDDGALACLRAEAIPDGEVPSPRAEALINSGEWDNFQKLTLVYVDSDACAGRIGTDGYRFCGKPRNYCKVATHTKNVIGRIVRGWYIACFGKTQGVFTSPFLPALEDGGPIRAGTAARLVDGENPFKLTKGQWRFIIETWHANNQDELSMTNLSAASSPVVIDTVETTGDDGLTANKTDMFDFSEMMKGLQTTTPDVFTFATGQADEIAEVRDDSDDRLERLERQFQSLLQKQVILENVNKEYENRLVAAERTILAKTRQLENEREVVMQGFRLMQERLQPLERVLGDGVPDFGAPQDIKDKLEEITQAVFGTQGPVETLKLQFSQFKDKLESDGGVTCNGVTFGSKREMLNWFDAKQPPVEIFMDALAYLHGIRSPVVYQEEATRQREAQIKTNMTNQLQVAVFTSFDTIIPSVLVGGKRMTDTGGGSIFSWLQSNIKNFECWKPKGGHTHGVSHTITSGITRVTETANELRAMQTEDAQAILLSVGMCTDSATFCNELVRFMSDQYEALTAITPNSAAQVWEMQLQCLQKIIEELSEARGRVAAAAHFNHGYYVWGMLQAWKVQKRYLANNFKDDPALNSIMVRRILLQGQDTTIKDHITSFEQLKNKVEEHHRQGSAELKRLKDMVNDLKKKKKGNNQGNNNNNNNHDENE